MIVPLYTRTAGLERYPREDRWGVYRATHQRLLAEDEAYLRRRRVYLAAVVCLALVPVAGWIAVIVLAWRQQAFQNRRVGEVLQAAARGVS